MPAPVRAAFVLRKSLFFLDWVDLLEICQKKVSPECENELETFLSTDERVNHYTTQYEHPQLATEVDIVYNICMRTFENTFVCCTTH